MAIPGAWGRLRLAREGGLVAAPGLMRPREIVFDDCPPEHQQRLASLVESCRGWVVAQPGRGDQRFFRLELFTDADNTTPAEQFTIDEIEAPPELVALWTHGIAGLD